MPYITQEVRKTLNRHNMPIGGGELNYMFTRTIEEYLDRSGVNYHNINTLIGALECAKLELYRRIAAPYEDKKLKENGDVYGALALPNDRQV